MEIYSISEKFSRLFRVHPSALGKKQAIRAIFAPLSSRITISFRRQMLKKISSTGHLQKCSTLPPSPFWTRSRPSSRSSRRRSCSCGLWHSRSCLWWGFRSVDLIERGVIQGSHRVQIPVIVGIDGVVAFRLRHELEIGFSAGERRHAAHRRTGRHGHTAAYCLNFMVFPPRCEYYLGPAIPIL